MKYEKPTFSVSLGSKPYRANWDSTFAKHVRIVSPFCHTSDHQQCDPTECYCRCDCHAISPPESIP